MKTKTLFTISCLCIATALPLMAAPAHAAAPKTPAKKTKNPLVVITDQLKTQDPAQIKQAVMAIRGRLTNGDHYIREIAARTMRTTWLELLMNNKDYADVAGLALAAEVALAYDKYDPHRHLEDLQIGRIHAFIAMKKDNEALAAAKGLYNVCSMDETHDALLLVAEALRSAHPGDTDLYNRFIAEQMAGGEAIAGTSATRPAETVLSAVSVEPDPYEAGLKWYEGEGFKELTSRGNLLLLADKPQEAKSLFERAYTVASEKELPYATESLARVMKAQDHTVARANAFVLSLRPGK